MDNPGAMLDEIGVTCEMLFLRFHRVGDFRAKQALWDALQEFHIAHAQLQEQIPERFGEEV